MARIEFPGFVALLTALLIPAAAGAQTLGPLGDLYLERDGGLAHYSSADPTGGNSDRRAIAPGETLVLVDHEGAGVVRRWWLTIAPRENREILRHLIVRCYWDGESSPSVEVPVADFFGMGFGEWKDFVSLPLNMTSGGYNAYWPMPFRRRARITVENTGTVPVESFYYNVDIRTFDGLPDDALYFHAQYRQTLTRAGEPVTILETTGRGHYVGTLLSMQPVSGTGLGYLEGDERMFVDGEASPSIVGTGTEDYFSSGWYYVTGEYSAPYHGAPIKDVERGRISTYRWHIEDPVPFDEGFRFEIEHGGSNDAPGVQYASVAYWYQTHPHAEFPPLPERLIPLATLASPEIEAEALLGRASVTGGELRVQEMGAFEGEWGGDAQLWWVGASPGDRLTLPIDAPAAGSYELVGFFTRAQDYGIVRLHVAGRPVGALMDGYAPRVEPTGPVSFGSVRLSEGTNDVVIELVGKDVRSAGYADGYLVGIDGFLLYRSPEGGG
ncbi:MAG: glycoside hydrolase family 172 protein [Longimicrobiales bacterium]